MDINKFWSLIDESRETAERWEDMSDPLIYKLSELDVSEIMTWHQIFLEYQSLSYKQKLWAGAYVINGGCSDDGFDYFRGWLTAQGKDVFLNALKEPDNLADIETCEGDVEFEDILGVAPCAYFSKMEMEDDDYDAFYRELAAHNLSEELKNKMRAEVIYADDIDLKWEEDNLRKILPKLCKAFDY